MEQGYLTEAIVYYVALLGWSPSDNREIFSLEELVEAFDYHHMSKSPAVFDTSSYEDLLEQGYLTEAIVNYVALLGWSPSDNREIFSLEELVEAFDYHHMSKSPAVFDTMKLKWMNGEYMKAMDFGL